MLAELKQEEQGWGFSDDLYSEESMYAETWMSSIGNTDLEMIPEGWTLAQKIDDAFVDFVGR